MQLTPHQPITIPSINLQPRTSTFDWYVYRGQVTWSGLPVQVAPVLPGALPVLEWLQAERLLLDK